MKLIVILCLSLMSLKANAQIDSVDQLVSKGIDSIQFSIWNVMNKELSTRNNVQTYQRLIAKKRLEKKDERLFLKTVVNPKSYNQSKAVLTHHNLVFSLYAENKIVLEIKISSYTGNINIGKKTDGIFIRSHCSKRFSKVLVRLLKRNGFLVLMDDLLTEGIRSNE